MKNMIKTALYSTVALSSVAFTKVSAAGANSTVDFDAQGGHKFGFIGGTEGGDTIGKTISDILTFVLGFLGLIAVIFAIYGGFQVLTAGGDEDKVKKGKTTLINALLGIFIILISWTLVNWLLTGVAEINTTKGETP